MLVKADTLLLQNGDDGDALWSLLGVLMCQSSTAGAFVVDGCSSVTSADTVHGRCFPLSRNEVTRRRQLMSACDEDIVVGDAAGERDQVGMRSQRRRTSHRSSLTRGR